MIMLTDALTRALLAEFPQLDEVALRGTLALVIADSRTKPTTAQEFINAAAAHMRDRAATYDKPEGERSIQATVTAFNAITGRDLIESDGWLFMQLLKDARQWQTPGVHWDSAEDCIAYAALKAESLAREAGCNGR